MLAHIKAEANWLPLVNLEWDVKKVENRGLDGDNAARDAVRLEQMLTFIGMYAPSSVFKEITQRRKSLKDIWTIIRKWAGVSPSGSKHLAYYKLKMAFDPAGQAYQEFYYALRDAKEDCLIQSTSNIQFNGAAVTEDEELTPCIEADVTMDWLHAIGGAPLVQHVFRVYNKELDTVSLADLQERISLNLPTLITEAESVVDPQT